MKKINVIVKEKTILELAEDAFKGDVIDLKELAQVDTSYIDSIIESGKDKVYQSKLVDVKKALLAENQIAINKLLEENKLLKQQAENDIKLKEKEVSSKYQEIINDLTKKLELLKQEQESMMKIKEQEINSQYLKQINELKSQIEILNKSRFSELAAINNKNQLEISNIRKQEENKYQKLDTKYNLLLAQLESQLKQKELEIENKYINEINKLKNDVVVLNTKKESEIKEVKSKAELDLEQALNEQKEKFKEELQIKEKTILNLQHQKANMNVKQIGEDLESWCDNEVISYMQNGLFNCTWTKDNIAVKNEGEERGSKADYIFKIYASKEHNESELLTSICLDMKDENPDSKTKQTNEHYYKKLEENRIKKECKYSVLVSNLELDKPNMLPIFKVRGYENMYVVRPGYLMVFLNMITSLSTRFSDLLLSKEQEMIELKDKLVLIEEFNKIKEIYLDDPLEALEKQISTILKSSESIKKASNDIDTACEKINSCYIKKIVDKLDKFELKLNKTIIKKYVL